MFYGNSHTTDPMGWISKFREHEYKILSVILHASKETCFERCRNDNNTGRDPINKQKELVNRYYDDFYQRERTNPFAQAAGVEEIVVNTEHRTLNAIAEEILMKSRNDFQS